MDTRVTLSVFLDGAVAMGCSVAGLFFLRFWRDSDDRLFVMFALAFWMFAASYALLGLAPLVDETRPYAFLLRVTGFGIIVAGIAIRYRNIGRGEPRH